MGHPIFPVCNQPIGRLGAAPVYPDFTGSQDAIDQASGYAAERTQQEVVETLAVISFLRVDVTDWQMRVTY